MDPASHLEIINCLRADADLHAAGPSGPTDYGMALRIWHEEVNRYAGMSDDRRMGMSIARALREDRDLIRVAREEEARAMEDRRIAMMLAEEDENSDCDDAFSMEMPRPKCRRTNEPIFARSTPAPEPPRVECIACTERTPQPDTIAAPCSHRYCRDCVSKLFTDSVVDETLFPPRCCRNPIPITSVQRFLTAEICKQFEHRIVEHNDLSRTYCSNRTCSVYLPPSGAQGERSRHCDPCRRWTCVRCKKGHYPGTDCPNEDDEVLRLGRRAGWRRCPHCRNLIELSTGCNHMTCRCAYEFCYKCNRRWKTCACDLFDEENLLERVNDAVGDGGQPEQVQQMAGRLRRLGECEHDGRWRQIPRGRRCDECRNYMPNFVMECRGCRVKVCVRCRYNRL